MPRNAAPLRLLAQDADDLEIISAALQDAVMKIADITFERSARLMTVSFNRYRWEAGRKERVRSALQLGGVLKLQARGVQLADKKAVLELLALQFEPGEAPAGDVTFSLAGGGDLRASVECIEAVLADISTPWPTPRKPAHDV